MVGDAGHRHPAQGLAGVLAGEGELQQARQQDRVLEEEFVEVAQPVEQHPVGMGRLEFHVVAQHRGEGGRVQQGMVVPAGQISIRARLDRRLRGQVRRRRGLSGVGGRGRSVLAAAAPGPGAGIGQQGLLVELVPARRCRLGGTPEGLRPKQVPLQARIVRERQLLLDIPGHGPVAWSLMIVRGLPGGPTTCESRAEGGAVVAIPRGRMAQAQYQPALLAMQILNTLTVLALVLLNWGMSFFVV